MTDVAPTHVSALQGLLIYGEGGKPPSRPGCRAIYDRLKRLEGVNVQLDSCRKELQQSEQKVQLQAEQISQLETDLVSEGARADRAEQEMDSARIVLLIMETANADLEADLTEARSDHAEALRVQTEWKRQADANQTLINGAIDGAVLWVKASVAIVVASALGSFWWSFHHA